MVSATVAGPPARRTQEQRKAETRGRLLGAVADLLAEKGVEAVSVDGVAERAGRTSGAVYAHFGSKQGMLLALLDEWRQSLLAEVAAQFGRTADLTARLRAVARDVVVSPSEDTRRLMALERELWRMAGQDRHVARAMRARAADAQSRMTRGFAAWREAGLIAPSADPGTMASAFRAMVVGLETAQRIDPVLDVDKATAALALVVGVGPDKATQVKNATQ